MKRTLIALIGCLAMAAGAAAESVVYSDDFVNQSAVGASSTLNYDLDLVQKGIKSVAVVATYSSTTIPATSWTDGRASTGQITVASLTGLATSYATNRITVANNAGVTGAQIRLNGVPITEGVDWVKGASSSMTAKAIQSAIAAKFSAIVSSSPGTSSVIWTTAAVYGKDPNSYTLTSSTPTAISILSATFTGGNDAAVIAIDGVPVIAGTTYSIGGTVAATATNIAAAINAHPTLSTRVAASAGGAIVFATSTVVGSAGNYTITSSTPLALVPSAAAMSGGQSAGYSVGSANISAPSHSLGTRLAVWFSTSTGVGLTPLRWGTTYYVRSVDANTISLSTTAAQALANDPIVFRSSMAATSPATFVLNSAPISGTPGFMFQVSNDASSWARLVTTQQNVYVSSVSMSAYTYGGAVSSWDLGKIGFRYLRAAITAPTTGAIYLRMKTLGKD